MSSQNLIIVAENLDYFLTEGGLLDSSIEGFLKKIKNLKDLNKTAVLKLLSYSRDKINQVGINEVDLIKKFKQANIKFFKRVKDNDPRINEKFYDHLKSFSEAYTKQNSVVGDFYIYVLMYLLFFLTAVVLGFVTSIGLAFIGFPHWFIVIFKVVILFAIISFRGYLFTSNKNPSK